jgi:3',5'-cyclic AMP phosphodiesterase CpdA
MKIILVTDTHFAPALTAFAANWQAIRRWIAGTVPDLVVHLGDITTDGASHATQLAAAMDHFAELGAPIRFLPGNHDIGDNPIAPDMPSSHPVDPDRLAEYRRLYGADRWSCAAAGWQLIGLNAQLLGTGGAEEAAQFDWLDAALAEQTGPLGLFLHKPLFRDGPADREAHVRYVPHEPRQRLLDLLRRRDLRFVAAGHTHQLRQLTVDGVEHVWTPSAAFCIPDAMQELIGRKIVGVLQLDLDADGHRFTLVQPPGMVRHNLLDHPDTYPGVAAKRAELGDAAKL